MGKLTSRAGSFLAGAVSVVLILVLLMAFGVVPVKTDTTTIVRTGAQTASTATTSSQSGLTPEQIYQRYSAGVVEVLSTFPAQGTSIFGQSSSAAQALGSGFVVSTDGYILTNAHVVVDNGQRASSVTVAFKGAGEGTQTTRVAAKVVGVDETSDVALLKVDPAKAPALQPVPLGNSSAVPVGEPVVAIGNPLGYDFSVTSGIVSATDRNLQSPNGSIIGNGIQTDAAINEGNSGGPLFDSTGHVIGINEQIASQSGGNQGLGFAVPINTAVSVMRQLQQSGKVTYAYLGVSGETLSPDVAKALGMKTGSGVLIASVAPGGPAAKAGLKGGTRQQTLQGQVYVTGGDIIITFDGKAVTSIEQLVTMIDQHHPGDKVTLTVVSGSATRQVTVTLAVRPANLG
jgi:S1-C subfamily serine protease